MIVSGFFIGKFMYELNHNQRYAGFGMRMLASAIDTALSILIMLPAASIFYKIYGYNNIQQLLSRGDLAPADMSREQLIDFISYQLVSFTWQNVIMAAAVIIFWIYRSATPGKILLKMKIVDAKTGGAPSTGQLVMRYLGYFISLLPLAIGFIWIYYDKKHQGFHDKIAGTIVIIERNKNVSAI